MYTIILEEWKTAEPWLRVAWTIDFCVGILSIVFVLTSLQTVSILPFGPSGAVMVMAAALIEARNIKRHLRKRDNNIDRVVKAIEKGYRWGGKPVEIPGTKLPTRTQILLDLFAFVLFLSGTFIWAYAEYLGI